MADSRRKIPNPAGNAAPVSRTRVDHDLRKAEFLRAAATVLLDKGASASMQEIAEGCGAQKPVFYRVFASRGELMDALFQHVHDTIVEVQKGKWDGYGWALRVLYLEARKEPDVFLVVLKTLRGDPDLDPWRRRLADLLHAKALLFFEPEAGAPAGAQARAIRASQTLSTLSFDTLVAWLEGMDGLTDEARFKWWGRIVREWRKATREAFRLDAPAKS
jgi:AcrR family transcriptional regulator